MYLNLVLSSPHLVVELMTEYALHLHGHMYLISSQQFSSFLDQHPMVEEAKALSPTPSAQVFIHLQDVCLCLSLHLQLGGWTRTLPAPPSSLTQRPVITADLLRAVLLMPTWMNNTE